MHLNLDGLHSTQTVEPPGCWQRFKGVIVGGAALVASVAGRFFAGSVGPKPTVANLAVGASTQLVVEGAMHALSYSESIPKSTVLWWKWRVRELILELSFPAYFIATELNLNTQEQNVRGREVEMGVLLAWFAMYGVAQAAATIERNTKERVVADNRELLLQDGERAEGDTEAVEGLDQKLQLPFEESRSRLAVQAFKMACGGVCLAAPSWVTLSSEEEDILQFWGTYFFVEPVSEELARIGLRAFSGWEVREKARLRAARRTSEGSLEKERCSLRSLRFARGHFGTPYYTLAGILLNYSTPLSGAAMGLFQGIHERIEVDRFTRPSLVDLVDVQPIHYQSERHQRIERIWCLARNAGFLAYFTYLSHGIFTSPENDTMDHIAWGTFCGTSVTVYGAAQLADWSFTPEEANSFFTWLFFRTMGKAAILSVDPSFLFHELFAAGVPLSDGAIEDLTFKDIAIPCVGMASWGAAAGLTMAQVDSRRMGPQPFRPLLMLTMLNMYAIHIAWTTTE